MSVFATRCARFRLQFVEQGIEAAEVALPELSVTFEPGAGFGERSSLQAARAALGVAAAGDKPGALENLEMLGNGGLAHGKRLRQFVDGGLAASEAGEDGTSRGIGQGGESGVEMFITTRLHN